MSDAFRKLYGDDLADQIEQIKRKPRGVEVLKPRRPKPEAVPDLPSRQTEDSDNPRWWDL